MDFTAIISSTITALPASSGIIVGACVLLILVVLVFKFIQARKNQKSLDSLVEAHQRSKASAAAKRSAPPAESAAEPEPLEYTPAPVAQSDTEVSTSAAESSTEIYEVDPREEAEIYLSYGHLEQAATTLQWYVERHREDSDTLQRLLDIYIEIPDLDRYAEYQDRFCSLSPDDPNCRQGILRGVLADPGNLDLRNQAYTYLGMDPDAVSGYLKEQGAPAEVEIAATQQTAATPAAKKADDIQLDRTQGALKQAVVNQEGMDLSGMELTEQRPGGAQPATADASQAGKPLIQGQMSLGSDLSDNERYILQGFQNPVKLAHLYLELKHPDKAITLMRRALLFDPRKLAYHVELLQILFAQKQIDLYAEALLNLYLGMWGSGKSLRLRMLNMGLQLGSHPLMETLKNINEDVDDVAELANRHGLHIPMAAIPFTMPPLVEERLASRDSIIEVGDEDQVLQEFDQLIEYGQTQEAVNYLEETIFAAPQEDRYYRPLMEMYERMGDLTCFTQFTEAVLKQERLPSEETLRLMIEVGERLKRQQSKRAV